MTAFRHLFTEPTSPRLHLDRTESVSALAARDWTPLSAGKGLYLSQSYLAAVEGSTKTRVTYLLARDDDGRLVGGLPC